MTGCGRQWCKKCRQEVIHRDNRKWYESASAIGQIIWREGPANISVMDLDVVSRKQTPDGTQLIRLLEQKQPHHKFERPQLITLRLLDAALNHCALCESAEELSIDPKSGVYVVRGEIAAGDSVRQETTLLGGQDIEQLRTGITWTVERHEQLFRFLDPFDARRRKKRAA